MLDHQVSVGWLRTRLKNAGGDTGNWSSTGMVSQFTDTLLQNLHDGGFAQLDVRERILLLLSFLEIPLRNMDNLTDSVRDIITLADEDSNEWVKVAANIVKDYPTERCINTELGDILPCYRSTIEEVKREMSKSQLSYTASRLPKQCVYLNPTCLTQMCGPSPAPVKHFTLTRKPKSAALRAKITQKASDAANQRRISTTSSSNTKTNLKRTVSSQSASKMVSSTQLKSFSKSAMQKKTKILEIADQPLGLREQKKRKKVLALEALQEKQEKKKAERLQKQQMKSKKNEDEGDEEEKHIDVTSDAEEQEENQEEANVDDSLNSSQDDIAEPPEDNPSSPPQSPQQQEDGKPPAQQAETTPSGSTTNNIGPPPQLTRDPVYNPPPQPQAQQPQQSMAQMQHSKAAIPSPNDQLQREMQMRAHQEREMHMRMQQQRMFQQQMLQQQQQQCAPRMGMMSVPPPPAAMAGIPPPPAHQRMPPPHLQPAQTPNAMHPPTPGGQQKKGLSLTREQMLAAHEMFRSANRVTKAEKTLILGFMAGARENPFPQQGPIITIKLSEDAEQTHGQAGEPGQRMIVEMLFEMNYDTGHWRRLKRTRVVSQQQNPQQQQQQSLQPPQHSQQQAQQQQQQMSQQMQQHQMQQHLQQQMQKQHFNQHQQ